MPAIAILLLLALVTVLYFTFFEAKCNLSLKKLSVIFALLIVLLLIFYVKQPY